LNFVEQLVICWVSGEVGVQESVLELVMIELGGGERETAAKTEQMA
jgi:hypothetical protein